MAFTCIAFAAGAVLLLWSWLAARAGDRTAFGLLMFGAILVAMAIFSCVALAKDPSRRERNAARPGRVATTHTLDFTVGDREKHEVAFTFDQMWGWLTISVDGRLIIKRFITVSFRLRREFEFEVGERERHVVRIEKTRPLLLAFANPQPIRAYCDGTLVAENDGIS